MGRNTNTYTPSSVPITLPRKTGSSVSILHRTSFVVDINRLKTLLLVQKGRGTTHSGRPGVMIFIPLDMEGPSPK